ncbi:MULTISPECIES: chemotaxis protein CheD [Roseobacter]|uniref:Probable chemoreceptor glutamine deamidase CheD n=1 Tax=Roseobacter litoralis (strain ATCC 49566 / DSM 6996 / JCM 21268 / NBRC 15278 / OCh 149) TaxID=391595 RepID=F7ZDF7_ROSLO|nr:MULTISPECIES: chemotaxis protein CheD [Roseobacter]AEI94559.1 putative chemoreceptor glutamine deamidase CheD [Roseobacter litoralis Och 149]
MTKNRKHITQGEWAVSADPERAISTILGSCVSCCLWDPVAKVGGMNHMLLTVSTRSSGACNLAGINAMELLINDILKLGGARSRLRAKAFGGARMVAGLSDVGLLNSQFTLDFLRQESIACEGHSLGGDSARHIMFWPASGRVMQKVRADEALPKEVPVQSQPSGNDLELF